MAFYNAFPVSECTLKEYVSSPYPVFESICPLQVIELSFDVIGIPYLGKGISSFSFCYPPTLFGVLCPLGSLASCYDTIYKPFTPSLSFSSYASYNDEFLHIESYAYATNGSGQGLKPSSIIEYNAKVEEVIGVFSNPDVNYGVGLSPDDYTFIDNQLTPDSFLTEVSKFVGFQPSGDYEKPLYLVYPESVEMDFVNFDEVRNFRDEFTTGFEILYGRTSFEIQVLIYKPSMNIKVQLPQDVDFDFSSVSLPSNIELDQDNKILTIVYTLNEIQRLQLNDVDGNTYNIDIIAMEADNIFFLEKKE